MKKILLMLVMWLMPVFLFAEEVVKTIPVDWTQLIGTLSKSVLDVVIPVLVAMIVWGVKKVLDGIKIGFIRSLVKKWVMSAFQQFVDKQERYTYVAKKIHESFKFLSEEEIKDYIEEAVALLKIELSKGAIPPSA
jgi:hypothetical protein